MVKRKPGRSAVRFLIVPLCAVLCVSASLRELQAQTLNPKTEAKINAILSSPKLKEAHVGISILDLGSVKDAASFPAKPHLGKPFRVLFERDAQKKFMPASNMKLFTAAIALQQLGREKTFPTRVFEHEKQLILYGGGDPSLTVANIEKLAEQIEAKSNGQRQRILLGDGSAYMAESSDGRFPFGWIIDDTRWYYGAEVSALAIERNHVDVRVTGADKEGELAQVEVISPLAKLIALIPPKVKTGHTKLHSQSEGNDLDFNWREHQLAPGYTSALPGAAYSSSIFAGKDVQLQKVATYSFHVGGEIASRQTVTEGIPFPNPSLMAAMALGEALQQREYKIDNVVGSGRFQPLQPDAQLNIVAQHDSPPLHVLFRRLLKNSDNLYAEMLLRNAAYYGDGTGSNKAGPRAHELLKQWLITQNIDTTPLRFEDGSGLSRYNLLTPRATAELLAAINRMPDGTVIWDALPIAGVDGTLKNRMSDSAAKGNVRAKTGTFSIASNLSGYVTTRDNRRLAVALYVNFARDTKTAQWAQDEVFKILAAQE